VSAGDRPTRSAPTRTACSTSATWCSDPIGTGFSRALGRARRATTGASTRTRPRWPTSSAPT
jgi:hypothetical protein